MGTTIQSVSNPIAVPVNTGFAGAATPSGDADRTPGGKMGKMEFLKLLTAQLANQDPMNPMDGKEMAADLAQFSGLEQLLNINAALDAQQGQFGQLALAMNNTAALGAVGRDVVIDSDKVLLSADAQGAVTGKVMADIGTSGVGRLTLFDKSGKEVGSRSLGYVGVGGMQAFDVGTAGDSLPAGAYSFRIDVTDPASGKDVPQQTYTVGRIDGLTYGADGSALLTMGPLAIAYGAIVKILAA